MNYIYYNEFGKEIKKYLSPIAKGSSGIKIYIFSDFDNSSETEYEVSASFKKADGFVAGDIFLPLSSNKKINPYNQQEMYYRELTIGNDVTDIVGGLELSIRYITINVITIDPDAEPPVTYNEEIIKVTGMVTFNIYNAVNFITPPQNTQLINLKNYVDNKDALAVIDNDNKLFLKADKIDTYLKTEVYNKDESYNQTEIDNLNDLNAKLSTTYTILETDELLDNKANIVILQSITTQPATATTNQIYYNDYDKKIYLYDGTNWGTNNVGLNGILYMFNNVLYVYNTYDGLIKIGQKPLGFNALYVDSLSSNTNDFNSLTVQNQIIANSGIDNKSNKIINVLAGVDNNDAVNVKQLADVIAGALSEYYKKVETYSRDEIIDLIASNYKAKGNLAPAGLVAGLLVKANLGNVYNITGQFTTTINFLEGAGIIHEAGENVAIVEYSAGVYKFDVLSSFVDLSGYVEKTTKVAGYDLQDDITVEEMETALGLINYVLKDGDKVLSTEDYTSEEKTKLGIALVNTLKIAGITVDDDISVEDLKAALVLVKGDVGLGNVENYDIATKVLAELGESNIKYMTPLRTKEAIDYNLIPVNTRIDTIADLSPYHYEGTFVGGDILQNDFDNLIVGFEDLREGTEFNETKLQGSYFVCSADSAFYFNTTYHWSPAAGGGITSAITYTWAAPYDLNGLTEINMKAGDIISILDFSYNAVSNTISTIIKVEKNLEENFVVKNETITGATKAKITYDAKGLVTAGADLTADDIPTHQHTKSEITDFPTIPVNKSYSKTITTANWTDKKYAVTISGLVVSDTVLLSGADDIFTTNGLSATITANTLTFEVTTTPTESIVVNFTVIKTTGGSV